MKRTFLCDIIIAHNCRCERVWSKSICRWQDKKKTPPWDFGDFIRIRQLKHFFFYFPTAFRPVVFIFIVVNFYGDFYPELLHARRPVFIGFFFFYYLTACLLRYENCFFFPAVQPNVRGIHYYNNIVITNIIIYTNLRREKSLEKQISKNISL